MTAAPRGNPFSPGPHRAARSVPVRDSKAPARAALSFPAPVFAALIGYLKAPSDG
ncbi:DUF397 domain-containing protein [Streptomyces sp. NPDC007157]|uniref:DUF397 domain-containing protein n=1 Tax=Streptomyces sp. NPDC007157 TaxID=3154681 RepID=UPI0033E901E7